MRHRSGMRNQGFDSAERLGQRTYGGLAEDLVCIRERSRFEGNQRSEARHLALRQFVLRMIRQSGIKNFLHFFVFRKIVSDSAAAAVVLLHANSQGLDAAQNQPALERRQNGSGGLLKKSKFLRLLGFGADHHTSQSVAVPVEEFRGGMDNHVGAKLDRTLKIRRPESVVDDDLNGVSVAKFADRA